MLLSARVLNLILTVISLYNYNIKHIICFIICNIIIGCDSTLYVGMMRKQNGGPIPHIYIEVSQNIVILYTMQN